MLSKDSNNPVEHIMPNLLKLFIYIFRHSKKSIYATEITEHFSIERSYTHQLLNKLDKHGLTISIFDSRRRRMVRLTTDGLFYGNKLFRSGFNDDPINEENR